MSTSSSVPNNPGDPSEFIQSDVDVERDRASGVLTAIVSPPLALGLSYLATTQFFDFFRLPETLGQSIGLGIGGLAAVWIVSRSFIENDAVMAFMTIDPLATLLKIKEKSLPVYGPGVHVSKWYERRMRGNSVDLSEAAQEFTFTAQAKSGGVLKGKYSIRLRPDIQQVHAFLGGVGQVAGDLGGLISAFIVDYLGKKTLLDALGGVDKLNTALKKKFQHGPNQESGVSQFEKRFGVIIGDVTVEELLPSEEVQKTMSAATESTIIDKIVENSFGCDSAKELQAKIDANPAVAEEVNRRRGQAMAMSQNLDNMELKESTINLKISGLEGIDPAVAEALARGLTAYSSFKPGVGGGRNSKRAGQRKQTAKGGTR